MLTAFCDHEAGASTVGEDLRTIGPLEPAVKGGPLDLLGDGTVGHGV